MYDNYHAYLIKERDDAQRTPICECEVCNRGIYYGETYFDVWETIVCDECIVTFVNTNYRKVATD